MICCLTLDKQVSCSGSPFIVCTLRRLDPSPDLHQARFYFRVLTAPSVGLLFDLRWSVLCSCYLSVLGFPELGLELWSLNQLVCVWKFLMTDSSSYIFYSLLFKNILNLFFDYSVFKFIISFASSSLIWSLYNAFLILNIAEYSFYCS